MPNLKHVVELNYVPSFRSEKVASMFDVPISEKLKKEWNINLPFEDKEWNIGVIVGASGSGKTTIAKNLFKENVTYFYSHNWEKNCLLDDFDKDLEINEIINYLSMVGFSSPPSWLLPYKALSNGQKFRVDLARALLETKDILLFDEFSSVVDRTVAKIGSHAIQKLIRKNNKKFIAVSCHYDILEWLEPNWVFDVSENKFYWGSLRRPSIKLEIKQVHNSIWDLFKGHHYLSNDINKTSKIFCAFYESNPIAICAILPFPHLHIKNVYKGHRTIVLPDFQGLGIGNKLSDNVGEYLKSINKRFISTTSHPAIINYRKKSSKWICTRAPSRVSNPGKKSTIQNKKNCSMNRLTCSFEYIGK